MASESIGSRPDSVNPQTVLASRQFWTDLQWEQRAVALAVRNRLAKVDRALHICGHLADLLVGDANASGNAGEFGEPEQTSEVRLHQPLSIDQKHALGLAMQALLEDAMECAEYVRINEGNCWGSP